MSDSDKPDSPAGEVFTDAAGHLAREVSSGLVRPMRGLRETLAFAVEKLDRHMGHAKGPTPLSWQEVDRLRQQLADAYLQCRALTRLASELADITREVSARIEPIDVNKLVDHALNLARHKIAANTHVFIDHGALPLVRGAPRLLVLAMVSAMAAAAQSAASAEGANVSITTRCESPGADDVVVEIKDDGGGAQVAAELALSLGTEAAEISGGSFTGHSESAKGCLFELRLPTGR